jgi:hypothetical protein
MGCLGRDRMVVGFTTTYAVGAYIFFKSTNQRSLLLWYNVEKESQKRLLRFCQGRFHWMIMSSPEYNF